MNEEIIELFIELHKNLDPFDDEMERVSKGEHVNFDYIKGLMEKTLEVNVLLEKHILDGRLWTLYEDVARCIENEEYEKIPQLKKEIEENEILYTNICAVP